MSAFLLSLVLSSTANAATPADVKAVKDYLLGHTPSNHYIQPVKEKWLGSSVSKVVFILDGKRYTLQYQSAADGLPASLDFWERPDGTTGDAVLLTYSDEGLDGVVDLGVGPNRNLTYNHTTEVIEGPQNKNRWQKAYDDAIAAALRYYRAP